MAVEIKLAAFEIAISPKSDIRLHCSNLFVKDLDEMFHVKLSSVSPEYDVPEISASEIGQMIFAKKK